MIDVENEVVDQSESEAIASAMSGYNKEARGITPPAEESHDEDQVIEQKQEEPQADPVVDLAEELRALKAKVASSSGDADTVRKMHGEIGNINRTLKQLSAKSAPDNYELSAALAEAEKVAEDFPEIAGPLVKAIRVLKAQPVVQHEEINIDERVTTAVSKIRERDAIESLAEEHPDFETVRSTAEFTAWLRTKTPEYQDKLTHTWNPAVVSKGLTEFKDSLKLRQKKQDRLSAAVVSPSTAQQPRQSTLTDEEAFSIGYNKGHKRLNQR